jgi:hypothetical protein
MLGLIAMLSVLSTTKEDRAAARERMRPIGRAIAPFVVALWAFIIWAIWSAPRR